MDDNIFRFGVTSFELKIMFIKDADEISYLNNTSERKRLRDLFLLFRIRGMENHAVSTLQRLSA